MVGATVEVISVDSNVVSSVIAVDSSVVYVAGGIVVDLDVVDSKWVVEGWVVVDIVNTAGASVVIAVRTEVPAGVALVTVVFAD